MKVQALYDFSGEPGSAELTIVAGEFLTVTRQDVGEGWWEGVNDKGQTGLFPAAYVEEVKSSNPPAMPPPPLPESFADDEWNNQPTNDNQNYEVMDYWDDEWDDDSEGGGGPPPLPMPPIIPVKSSSIGDDMSLGRSDSKSTMPKKSLNRFSMFVKSGGENYIMGTLKLNVSDADKVYIVENDQGGVMWNPLTQPYVVAVASHKKESKFRGLKSFIAYQLTPTFNNIQVSRRYKHFDWLHERLEEKFSLIPIPPLPEKQISGRYERQLIERRMNQLQAFVDFVCRHPVLSQCSVWEHFLTCTDEKKWKPGKRKAEKDELVGANYFLTLQAPDKAINIYNLEQETESCSRFVHSMDIAVKVLMACSQDQTKKHQGLYKREYEKIGLSFCNLAQAFGLEEASGSDNSGLSESIRYVGDTYNDIGKLFDEQPKHDWGPLGDILHIYKGILAAFPDILTVHKDTMAKRKDCERLTLDHKMETSQLQQVVQRTDVVSYALLAEINHFHAERTTQIRKAMKSFLCEQVAFYQKIAAKLQDAYSLFEDQ
uniref:Sorting nexin n=2 Tax=Homalodisca liturata TaxID=320908 RepID=A0A1B6HWD0_9HEMI